MEENLRESELVFKCSVEKRSRNCFIRKTQENFAPEQILQIPRTPIQKSSHENRPKSKKNVKETRD